LIGGNSRDAQKTAHKAALRLSGLGPVLEESAKIDDQQARSEQIALSFSALPG
jgi:hypothetical protein